MLVMYCDIRVLIDSNEIRYMLSVTIHHSAFFLGNRSAILEKYVAEQCLRRNLLTPQYFNITVHLVLFATSTSVIEPTSIVT